MQGPFLAAVAVGHATSLLKARAAVDKMCQDPNPQRAAEAWETSGILLKVIWADESKAEAAFRRAPALDPSRAVAWHMLLGLLCGQGRKDAAIQTCQEKVRQQDAVIDRLTLAYFHEHEDRLSTAQEQIQQARCCWTPKSPEAHIAQAAMLLKYDEGKQWPSAEQHLRQAAAAMGDSPTSALKSSYCLVQGIYQALRQ